MKPKSGFAVASLVLGILNIIIAVIAYTIYYNGYNVPQIVWSIFLILVFIIAGLTTAFGVIAFRQTEYNSNHSGRGIAITGLWLGGIGLFLTLIGVVILYLAIAFSS